MDGQGNSLSHLQGSDPILREFALGYMNASGTAQFVAPLVSVPTLSGSVLQFGKEAFAADDTFRAPGTPFSYGTSSFTTRQYALRQEALGWSVPEEHDAVAKSGDAKLDLRRLAILTETAKLANSWEFQVARMVQNPANYEPTCVRSLTGADKFSNATSDPEQIIDDAKEAVAAQIGTLPNRMVLSVDAYNSLKRNKRIREYTQRGTIITPQVLANIFDIKEVRVARTRVLNKQTGKIDYMWANSMALLFQPDSEIVDGFVPAANSDRARPASFYTYQQDEGVIATPERFDANSASYRGELKVYRAVQPIGLGENGLVGGAFLFMNVA